MANPRIGRMRHRITLKKQSDSPSDTFSNKTVFKDVATVWGELVSIAGRSYYTVRNLLETTSHTLTIRYDKNLDTLGENDHAEYCGRLFRISSSQIYDERNRFIIFQLEEMGETSSYVDQY